MLFHPCDHDLLELKEEDRFYRTIGIEQSSGEIVKGGYLITYRLIDDCIVATVGGYTAVAETIVEAHQKLRKKFQGHCVSSLSDSV